MLRIFFVAILFAVVGLNVEGFTLSSTKTTRNTELAAVSRRGALLQSATAAASTTLGLLLTNSQPALAAAPSNQRSLDDCLYLILRAKEATQQETRLIGSGRFKDVQRANVKLAVRFILQNYRLSDTVIAASAYITDNSRRITAGEAGQAAVQDLLTILEYFDSSDVQNLKVRCCCFIIIV